MNKMFRVLVDLLRLRSGPQDLSSSWALTGFLIAAYLILNLITGERLDDDNAMAKSLSAIVLQVTVLLVLLNWRHHPERFTQTLSALAAVGIVFNFITWMLLSQSTAENQPVLALFWFGVFFWSLFVDANIYKHALGVSLSIGVLISVLTLAASFAMIELLFLESIT
jgi:hypothetical protein